MVRPTSPMLHVQAMTEFAESVLREARDRGLLPTRRRSKRRGKRTLKPKPKAPAPKRAPKKKGEHPLATEEA